MRVVAALLLLLLPLGLLAQGLPANGLPAGLTHPDSLRAWQPRPPTADTVELKRLINASNHRIDTNFDSARYLAQAAVALAWRRHQGIGLVYGLVMLSSAQYYANSFAAAQRSYEQLLWAARRCHRPEQLGGAYMGMGLVARGLGNWAGAEHYFVQAQRAYASTRPPNGEGQLNVLVNRAYNFLDIDSTARARPLVEQALARQRQLPQARHPAKRYVLLGLLQKQEGQLAAAARTYRQAARLAHRTSDLNPEAEALLGLAELAARQPDHPQALRYARQAEGLFHELGDPQEAEALRYQALAQAALHQPADYLTLRRYLALADSINAKQRVTTVANAQARFDQAAQQARIRALEQQGRIVRLEAAQRTLRNRVLLAALGALALLLAGWGRWAYRRRQAHRDAALRTRLAADLHDDVGGLLTQISLESALLEEGSYAPAQQQARLHRVAEASRNAARQMRDVVWSVDARNDSFMSLLDQMHDYAHEVLAPTGTELRFEADPALKARPLGSLGRQSLYLIFKEALHNVAKHAQATEVRVNLRPTAAGLRLEVRDNGRGSPATEPAAAHGLRNMRMRAEAVGGTVHYDHAGPGFGVVALLPL